VRSHDAHVLASSNPMKSDSIVAIDDQPEVRRLLTDIFRPRGRDVVGFKSGEDAQVWLAEHANNVGLIVLDLDLGVGVKHGLTMVPELHTAFPDIPIIILTGNATIDSAVQAVKAGASDFLVKDMYLEDKLDLSVEKIDRMLTHLREQRRLEGENRELRAANRRLREAEERRLTIVGESDDIREIMSKVEKVARVPRPVLILGERGTGKELIAAAIHRLSPRANHPFITVNCGAITETLLESELFGHESGAFTGATKRKEGKFELADGGTLFLDEIGNMSLEFQQKILRVLEYPRFERVAGHKTIEVDVRVIAATNADLTEAMKAGSFRRDLFDRLSFETIRLPPLRQRLRDVPALAGHLLALFRVDVPGIVAREFTGAALERLLAYDFPGNVRELKNVVERAAYAADRTAIDAPDVDRALPPRASTTVVHETVSFVDDPSLPLPERVAAFEKALCKDALDRARFNQRDAAGLVGLTYDQFRHLYRKYGLASRDTKD
jgi:psp operon transcriptional activator PspF